jgi:hypothetical protein
MRYIPLLLILLLPRSAAHSAEVPHADKPAALSPASAAFLREIKLDPESADVRAAVADGKIEALVFGDPESFSVEKLAKAKKKGALTRFVVTRGFISRLKRDFAGTAIPKESYEAAFLSAEERQLVGRKVAEGLRTAL